jgi:hypothetical protein
MKRMLVVFAGVLSVIAIPMVVSAHNVGHFVLNGSCLQVGSAKEAPLVGPDGTQLDLVPETANPPRDEYGTSFVGFHGNTRILPGLCPATVSEIDTAAVPAFATVSFQ